MTMMEKMNKITENKKALAVANQILSDARERNLTVSFDEVTEYVYNNYCK
jgi:hypothetical protein